MKVQGRRYPSRRELLAGGLSGLALTGLAGLAGCAGSQSAVGTTTSSDPAVASSSGSGTLSTTSAAVHGVPTKLTVAKSPTCGCCELWIEHAKAAGVAQIDIEHPASMPDTFAAAGVPEELQACHLTRTPDGQLFVGHIPMARIADYLHSAPAGARGLAVPGMPLGSPGMESGDAFEPYDILVLSAGGGTEVFARMQTPADQV